MIGYVIENILEGKEKVYHWHDIEALQARKDITLLDIRTEEEYSRGHIEGYINIPLDSLRQRIGN